MDLTLKVVIVGGIFVFAVGLFHLILWTWGARTPKLTAKASRHSKS